MNERAEEVNKRVVEVNNQAYEENDRMVEVNHLLNGQMEMNEVAKRVRQSRSLNKVNEQSQ